MDELLSECKEIQRLIKERNEKKRPEKSVIKKGFTNLMMEGKVKQATKLIDADSQVTGVHQLTERIRNALQDKHPEAEEIDESVIQTGPIPQVEAVRFEEIDMDLIVLESRLLK